MEGERTLQPQREIFLTVELVARHDPAAALIVGPGRIFERVDGVGNLIAEDSLSQTVAVGTACQLVPGVIGYAVMVDVLAPITMPGSQLPPVVMPAA